MRITVIIPTYNEAENLANLVSALFLLPLDLKVLVVDDESPDGTGAIAEEIALLHPGKMDVLHRHGERGLRAAYLEGFRRALNGQVDAIAQMDADLSHDPSSLLVMTKILENHDVVLGSRYIDEGSVDEDWSFWRKVLSRWGNFYSRTILHLPIRDVTTGYRLWRAEALRGMPLDRIHADGYIFLVEMIYLAQCLEYRIAEAPIHFHERKSGISKMNFKIQAEAAMRVWQVLLTYNDLKVGRKKRRRIV